jgi:quinol monooxygenase YgiN
MHAAIRRYNMFPNATDTIRTRVNEELLPTMRQLPGFVAYYVVDGGDGTLIAISVFEDRAVAEESTRHATQWVRERLSHLIRTAPVISTGAVIAHGEGAVLP